MKLAAASIGVTLGVTLLRRRGDANWGLPFAPRNARRAASPIPAAFVPASFASSRIGAASRRGTERFDDHDLTAARRRRELGLPFAPRIARRGASLIPAPFVLGSFAPSRIGAASCRGTERFDDHDLTAARRRRELGLPFAPRIARRGASLIPAPFVPASFAPSRIGAAKRHGTERFGDHGLTSDGLWDKARGWALNSATH